MPGESPLSMMRTPDRPLPRRTAGRSRGRWIAGGAIIVALAVIWTCLWYYAAAIVEQTLAGWYQREAGAGRVYSCGSQSVGGFPFELAVHCNGVAADVKSAQPAFSVAAKTAIFDQRFTMIGSHNLDTASYRYNLECNVLIDSVELAKQARASFERDLEESK